MAVYIIVNGTYGKRSSAHALSMRDGVHDISICLNHRDELDRSTLDLYSGRKGQISMLQSQRRTQDRSVVARVRVYVLHAIYYIYSKHVCYKLISIALASFIYTRLFIHGLQLRKPKERVKSDRQYLSEKVTYSF